MWAFAFLSLIVLAPALAYADPVEVKQTILRYDEDWSVLRNHDGEARPWWRPLKNQPLNKSGSAYASFGVDARIRYEGFHNHFWGGGPAPDDGYTWLRAMPHADLHVGPVRGFVQLIASDARGVAGGAGPADSTGVDLLQGFADVRLPLADDGAVTLRLGRALAQLGSERLVGARYGPNVPQAFDGAQVLIESGPLQARIFDVSPTATGQDDFDDSPSSLKEIGGVYATLTLAKGAGLDLYWLHFQNDKARYAQGAGDESRDTYGARFFGQRQNLSWNWEAMLQRGRFAAADIRAWSVATETAYRFSDAPLKPRLRVRANIASGDRDASDRVLGTFNPMFPRGKYFGELYPIGPFNIVNVHPSVDLDLGRGLSLDLSAGAYWRMRRADGVYDVPGRLIRAPGASQDRFIGTQIEAVLTWRLDEALSFSASLSAFQPGGFIEQTGPARDIHMVGFETGYRF